jgi:hypothetical protein
MEGGSSTGRSPWLQQKIVVANTRPMCAQRMRERLLTASCFSGYLSLFPALSAVQGMARRRPQEGEDKKLELNIGKAQQRPATDLSSKTKTDQMEKIRYRSRRRSDQIRPSRAKSLRRYTKVWYDQ